MDGRTDRQTHGENNMFPDPDGGRHNELIFKMNHCIRKPTKCLGKNKGADQLHGNREADQRLCFCYTDTCSTIPLLLKSEISSF